MILFDIFSKGISVISWEFLSQPPQQGMTEGGIFPALLGTFLVSLIGPSGCGKTTFLRCLNRMNDIVEGARVEGKILWTARISTLPRGMGSRFASG